MPIPVLAEVFYNGLEAVPWAARALRIAPWVLLVSLFRWYFSGSTNHHERIMNSRVVMVTVRSPFPWLRVFFLDLYQRKQQDKANSLKQGWYFWYRRVPRILSCYPRRPNHSTSERPQRPLPY